MTLPELMLAVFGICILAGVLGSLLGLGGGVIVVPALTLLFHVDIRLAIGASIVSVIATSSAAASAYVRERMSNIRLGLFLTMATTVGAVTGAYLSGIAPARVLYVVFGVLLAVSGIQMLRGRHAVKTGTGKVDPLAERLRLHDSFYDGAEGREVTYRVQRTRVGLGLMYIAGLVSGLLGIGSGVLKVPAMDLAMRLPMKVSTATSNFMIGVTAAASTGVFFLRGDIDPFIAAPVALGVLGGASVGARALPRVRSSSLRLLFVAVLIAVSVEMILKGAS